jgi:hypothetical protein
MKQAFNITLISAALLSVISSSCLCVETPDLEKENKFDLTLKRYRGNHVNFVDVEDVDEPVLDPKDALVEAKIKLHHVILNRTFDDEAFDLINYAYESGELEAVMLLAQIYSDPLYGYQSDDAYATHYNDILVEQGHSKALRRAVYGYTHNLYGYKQDEEKAFTLTQAFAEMNHKTAIKLELDGLAYGIYGYKANRELAVEKNEDQIKLGNIEALKRKVDGLGQDRYGYKKDTDAARKLIQAHATEEWAQKRMAIGKTNGAYGFEINLIEAKAINDLLVQNGNRSAAKRKAMGLLTGSNGYQQNIDEAYFLIRQWRIIDLNLSEIFLPS